MSFASEVTADAPGGWWRLDEPSGTSGADSSGHSNGGTYSGSVTLGAASLINSDVDAAATFGGGRLTVPTSGTLSPTVAVSVMAWFKPSSLPGASSVSGLVWKAGAYGLTVENFGGVQRWAMHVTIGGVDKNVAINTPTPTIGTKYQVFGTYDGANIKIYVNGALQATQAQTGAISTSGSNLTVGDTNGASPAAGVIDEAAMYPAALTVTRILAQYTAANATVFTRTLSASSTCTATLLKPGTFARSLAAVCTSAAARVISILVSRQAAPSSTVTLARMTVVARATSSSSAGALKRDTSVSRKATSTPSAALVAGSLRKQSLLAASTASVVKRCAVAIVRTGTPSSASSLTRASSVSRAATSTPVGALSTVRSYLRTLIASSAAIAALKRSTAVTRAASSTPVAVLLRLTGRTVAASSTATASRRIDTSVSRKATSTPSAAMSAGPVFLRTLIATVTGSATLQRATSRALGALSTGTATVRSGSGFFRILSTSSTGNASSRRQTNTTKAATSTATSTQASGRSFGRTLLATSTVTATLNAASLFFRTLTATTLGQVIVNKATSITRMAASTASAFVAFADLRKFLTGRPHSSRTDDPTHGQAGRFSPRSGRRSGGIVGRDR